MMEDPLLPLSFIGGAAILTNACAVMQNGATTRYNLAITQWRSFRASAASHDGQLSLEYADPQAVLRLAERRIRLQLRSLNLLNTAVALFAVTTVLGLGGSLLADVRQFEAAWAGLAVLAAGAAGLLFLLAATVTFFLEAACGSQLLGLHVAHSKASLGELRERSSNDGP